MAAGRGGAYNQRMRHKRARATAVNFDAATRIGFFVHELRNALACVFVAQALIRKSPNDHAAAALLERNLLQMKNILDSADSQVRFHKEPHARRRLLDLADAVREVAASAGEQARLKDVMLSVRVEPRLGVNADPEYLVSALSNLIGNAIKFTPRGGTVRVRGLEKGNAAVIEVEDQCGGLPTGRIEDLFEPFTQKGADRSGLGLGLAISRRAVALNDGALSARDLPGKGCVFTITLPLAVAARAHERRMA